MTPSFPADLTPRQQRSHKADRRIVQQRYEKERRRNGGQAAVHIVAMPLVTAQVVDLDDAERFPNIAEARAWLASLSPERRDELQADWENGRG